MAVACIFLVPWESSDGGELTNGFVADGVGVEVGAKALQLADEVETTSVDSGALFNFSGECHGAGSEEGNDGSGELHLDGKRSRYGFL